MTSQYFDLANFNHLGIRRHVSRVAEVADGRDAVAVPAEKNEIRGPA
jgi:hypothetical protein